MDRSFGRPPLGHTKNKSQGMDRSEAGAVLGDSSELNPVKCRIYTVDLSPNRHIGVYVNYDMYK